MRSFPLKTKRRSLMIKHRGLNSRKFRVFPQSLCFEAVSYYMVIIGTWIWGHLAQPALFYVHFTTFLYLEIQLPKTNFHQLGLSWSKQTYCRTKVKNKNAQAWHSKHMDISTRRLSVPGKPGFKATGLTQKSRWFYYLQFSLISTVIIWQNFILMKVLKRRVVDYRVIMLKVILVMFCKAYKPKPQDY